MRALLLFLVLCTLIQVAVAETVCNQILVDDFERQYILNWKVLYEGLSDVSVSRSDFAHGGNYSIVIWNNRQDEADFAAEHLNATFAQGKNYTHYNLSFWYFAECPPPAESSVYLSHKGTFSWSAIKLDTPLDSCGSWKKMNIKIDESYTWKSNDFSLGEGSVRSLDIENTNSKVYYDDIKLIPSTPEMCCNESWLCGGWSRCYANSTKYRLCWDSNSCGTEIGKPVTETGCVCAPIWVCGEWGGCFAGVRSRSCDDLNSCEVAGMPEAVQECASLVDAEMGVLPVYANLGESVEISADITDEVLGATVHIAEPGSTSTSSTMGLDNGTHTSIYTGTSSVGIYRPYIEVTELDGDTSWFTLEQFEVFEAMELHAQMDASAYRQGDTVSIHGEVSNRNQSANCTLRLSSGLWEKSLAFSANRTLSINYTIGVVDPVGEWDVGIVCEEGQSMGKEEFEIEVVEVVRFPYFSVEFIEPVGGQVYYQGDRVDVVVQVRKSGSPVPGATTFVVLPDGRRIAMDESGSGNYYTQFDVQEESETGDLSFDVVSVGGNQFGENNVTIDVRDSGIRAQLMEPIGSYLPGDTVHIKINVTRADGSVVTGARLKASVSGENVTLPDRGSGVYETYYTARETGEWTLLLHGIDGMEYDRFVLTVREANLLDSLARNFFQIAFLAGFSVLVLVFFRRKVAPAVADKFTRMRIEKVKNLQSQLRDSYFKLGEIRREAFDRRNREYEKEMAKLKKRLGQ